MRYPGGLIASSPVNAAYPSGVWTQAQTQPYAAQNVWMRDQFWPNTTLLLQGNGTNGAQNNTFLDSSTNNFTITRNGNTTQGSFTPYEANGYWSNYFDGSSSFLSYTDSSTLNFGTGSYTFEFWIFGPSNNDKFILGNSNTSTIQITTGGSASTEGCLRYVAGGSVVATSGSVLITNNQWNHCAIVRNGSSNVTLYVNGVSVGTGTDSTNYTSTNSTVTIAKHNSVSGNYLTGYLSNLRIVKGTAVYTANFTPPAAPLTAISGTSLLTCQGNRFLDVSSNAFALTVSGSPSVQAFQPFPGATTWSGSVLGGSGYFDGSGDYLNTAYNSAFSLGTGAFTVEAWVYLTAAPPASAGIITLGTGAVGGAVYSAWSLFVGPSLIPSFYRFDGTEYIYSSSTALTLNAWSHIAVVRDGSNNFAIFLNGTRVYSATVSQSFANVNTDDLYIARFVSGGGATPYYPTGYINDCHQRRYL